MSNKSDITDIEIASRPDDYLALKGSGAINIEDNINGRMSNIFLKSLSSLFRNNKNIYDLFFSLTKKLNKFFSLSRSILVIRSMRDDDLKVIAMKGPQNSRIGLALTLPRQNSIIYQVLGGKEIYTENYPHEFSGNFIERKLLLDDNPGSIAICPIKNDGDVCGLICLTSPALYAFTLFRDGALDAVLERFGKSIEREISRLYA